MKDKKLEGIVSQLTEYFVKDIAKYAPSNYSLYDKTQWIESEMENITVLITDKFEKMDEDKND